MFKINNLKINSAKTNTDSDGQTLVENATLEINAGEIVLLEGSNGSGKTTILNSIMHNPDYKIEQGQIFVNGLDATMLETHELAKMGVYLSMQHSPEIGGVSTIKMLYKASKFVNEKVEKDKGKVDISITEFKKELEAKCELFALDSLILMRDVNVGFSGGEKKQADLIHMLALDPKIILMDEPDSGVDRDAISKVYNVINYFKNKGAAILLTSHNERVRELIISRVYRVQDRVVTEIK